MIGNRKAAVLPVPVCAEAMISRPSRIGGMTASCTGVAVSYPDAEMPSKSSGVKLNSVKRNVGILIQTINTIAYHLKTGQR